MDLATAALRLFLVIHRNLSSSLTRKSISAEILLVKSHTLTTNITKTNTLNVTQNKSKLPQWITLQPNRS